LVVPQIGKAKDLSAPLRIDPHYSLHTNFSSVQAEYPFFARDAVAFPAIIETAEKEKRIVGNKAV
jgi:hypothetical protein